MRLHSFPTRRSSDLLPTDGQYGGYYCQAVNATAPHANAARLWEEFIYSDQGQLLYLKGYAHPARFADLVARKAIPKALASTFPASWLNAKPKFASLGQINSGKAVINTQWPAKVGTS